MAELERFDLDCPECGLGSHAPWTCAEMDAEVKRENELAEADLKVKRLPSTRESREAVGRYWG